MLWHKGVLNSDVDGIEHHRKRTNFLNFDYTRVYLLRNAYSLFNEV